jgi:hypothetical protein
MKSAVEGEEQVTHVASALARADKPRSGPARIKFIKEEEMVSTSCIGLFITRWDSHGSDGGVCTRTYSIEGSPIYH